MVTLYKNFSDGAGNVITGVMRYSERNYELVDIKYYNANNEQYSGDLFNINSPILDSNSKPLWEVKTLSQNTILYDVNGIEYNGEIILGDSVGSAIVVVQINFSSSPYTVIPTTGTTLYQVDCSDGDVIMNFPTAIGSTAIWGVKKIDSSLNTITLEPFGAQTIDGNANQTILFQNTQVDIYSDNSNLFIK